MKRPTAKAKPGTKAKAGTKAKVKPTAKAKAPEKTAASGKSPAKAKAKAPPSKAGPLKLRLLADFRQIHLADSAGKGDLTEAWTAQATDDRVASAKTIIGIGAERDEQVLVTAVPLPAAPRDDAAKFDHVTEASIAVDSGQLVIMGCTDYWPDARRLTLKPGSYRVRASHSGLAKGPEKIRLQIWPAAKGQPTVVKRWAPPPPQKKPPIAPGSKLKTAKQAVAAALQGQPDAALEALLGFAQAGDVAASASAAELLGFMGRWADLVPHAAALIAKPDAVYAGNVFDDMCALLRRAARELGTPDIIKAAAATVRKGMEARRDAVLLQDSPALGTKADPENRARYEQAVAESSAGKRFKGKPDDLARHCFALAVAFNVDDAIIARYDPKNPRFGFEQAVYTALALARRGDAQAAWAVLEPKLGSWWPVDRAQVAPVELIVHPLLLPLMTPERCRQLLETPRGAEA